MKLIMSFMVTAMMMLFLSDVSAQIRLQSPQIVPPPDSGSTNWNFGLTNRPPGKLFQPIRPLPKDSVPERPLPGIPPIEPPVNDFSSVQRIPPGIYETEPYAGIVLVPGPEHDDCSVVGPGNANKFSNMPIITPDVKMIPLSGGKP